MIDRKTNFVIFTNHSDGILDRFQLGKLLLLWKIWPHKNDERPVYRHPLPTEGAMGEGYENRCGFSLVLHHFGLFFLESEDEIYPCLFKTIVTPIHVPKWAKESDSLLFSKSKSLICLGTLLFLTQRQYGFSRSAFITLGKGGGTLRDCCLIHRSSHGWGMRQVSNLSEASIFGELYKYELTALQS